MPPKFFEGLSNEDMENIKAIAMRYVALDFWLMPPELIETIVEITTYHQNYEKINLAALAGMKDSAIRIIVRGMCDHMRNNPLKG